MSRKNRSNLDNLSHAQKVNVLMVCKNSQLIKEQTVRGFAKRADMHVDSWTKIIDEFQLFFANPSYDPQGILYIIENRLGENRQIRDTSTPLEPLKQGPDPYHFPIISQFNLNEIEIMRKNVWSVSRSSKVKRNLVLRAYQRRLTATIEVYKDPSLIEDKYIAQFCGTSEKFIQAWKDLFLDAIKNGNQKKILEFGEKCGLNQLTEPRGIVQTINDLVSDFAKLEKLKQIDQKRTAQGLPGYLRDIDKEIEIEMDKTFQKLTREQKEEILKPINV